MSRALAIAGTGRMAQALGRLLARQGWPVAAVAGRDVARTEAAARFVGGGAAAVGFEDLHRHAARVLVCVSDDAIRAVAGAMGPMEIAIHTSGLHGLEPLDGLRRAGCAGASMHPLQTVPAPAEGVLSLPGAWFAIAGDDGACGLARELVESMGARWFAIDGERRAVYHAAAVMASNYVNALLDAAVILMERAGVDPEAARGALEPLVAASVENALRMTPEKALTGPIRRGDAGSVALHVAALDRAHPEIARLYRALGRHTVEVAVRAGLPPEAAGQLEMILSEDRPRESNG